MTSTVTLLTQHDCHMCVHAKQVPERLGSAIGSGHRVDLSTHGGQRLAEEAGVLFAPVCWTKALRPRAAVRTKTPQAPRLPGRRYPVNARRTQWTPCI